jgi:hypothetical protein
VHTGIDGLLELEKRPLDGLVHLLRLPTGTSENNDPPILAQFFA